MVRPGIFETLTDVIFNIGQSIVRILDHAVLAREER